MSLRRREDLQGFSIKDPHPQESDNLGSFPERYSPPQGELLGPHRGRCVATVPKLWCQTGGTCLPCSALVDSSPSAAPAAGCPLHCPRGRTVRKEVSRRLPLGSRECPVVWMKQPTPCLAGGILPSPLFHFTGQKLHCAPPTPLTLWWLLCACCSIVPSQESSSSQYRREACQKGHGQPTTTALGTTKNCPLEIGEKVAGRGEGQGLGGTVVPAGQLTCPTGSAALGGRGRSLFQVLSLPSSCLFWLHVRACLMENKTKEVIS